MSGPWVRPASSGDIPALVAIDEVTNPLPWSAAQHAEELGRSDAFVLVADSGQVDGFVTVRVMAGDAEVLLIAVAPQSQRRGVGGRLLDCAINEATTRGAETLRLEVRAGNAAALSLYASRGFERVGLRRRYYRDNGEDAVLLDRVLDPPAAV